MQSLPAALAPLGAYRQFITYVVVPSQRPGKTDKFPTDWRTGAVVNAHDPTMWASFAEAATSPYAIGPNVGVGFVVTAADPFWFIDVDGCVTPEGQWSEVAQMLFKALPGAAVEVSQSGTGLHFFGSGPVPEHGKKNKQYGLELYTERRFAALTGTAARGDAAWRDDAMLTWLATTFFPPIPGGSDEDRDQWPVEPRGDWRGPTGDDELLRRALRSQSARAAFGGGASFADLWTADERVLGPAYPSDKGDSFNRSGADAALAAHLCFWTGCDAPRIERLMRSSALAREKWDRHQTYMRITIASACARQKDVLRDAELVTPVQQVLVDPAMPPAPPAPSMKDATKTYINVDDQDAWFKGCVYVMDQHRVLVPGGQMLNPDRFKVMYGGVSFPMDRSNERTVRDAWECFTQSQAVKFPKVTSTCFRPELASFAMVEEEGHSLLNVYHPIHTTRQAGDPAPFLDLLARILPVERDRRIILSYCSAMVRNIGRKFQWWPVLQGTEGNGKSVLIRCLAHAIGHRYTHLPNVEDMARNGNKFNGWILNKLFIGIEEIYVANRRDFLNAFKPTVTNDRIPVESKGIDQITADNRANGMMCTNHRDGVPIDIDQRRYAVFFTAQQSKADKVRDGLTGSYFPLLYDWLKGVGTCEHLGSNYGYSVVNELFHTYAIDPEFDPAGMCQVAPDTSSSVAAVRESLGGVEQEVMEAIELGLEGFRGGWVSSTMLDRLLGTSKGKSLPVNKRRELLERMGYGAHPSLPDGRVMNMVMPDGAKSRLFIHLARPELITLPAHMVSGAYTEAQKP